jgi:hypothetical protein
MPHVATPNSLPTTLKAKKLPVSSPTPSIAISFPANTNIIAFDACDSPYAFREFLQLLPHRFPSVSVGTEEFVHGWQMPKTRIYFVKPSFESHAQKLSSWLPSEQDVFDYNHQESAVMPERPNGPIAHMVVDPDRDLIIFLGNDYSDILKQLSK